MDFNDCNYFDTLCQQSMWKTYPNRGSVENLTSDERFAEKRKVLLLLQKSEKGGASETIVGSSGSNFYEKNKGRTREGRLKKLTILFSVVFIVLTIVLTILNMR